MARERFWNGGRDTIKGSDVSANDPLRIEVLGAKVLDVSILATTSPAVSPEVGIDSAKAAVSLSFVGLSFDYLDRQEGFLVQLMHTGPESADVDVKGRIKGAGEPRRRDEEPWWLIFAIIFGSAGFASAVGALAAAIVNALNGPDWLKAAAAILFGVGGFALALLGFVRWESHITRVPKALSGVRLPRLEKRLPGARVG
jgi:hypothetical protein